MFNLFSALRKSRPRDLGAAARQLAAEGRYADAVRWRSEAFATLPSPSGRPDWPPPWKTLFPGVAGVVPEIDAAHLTGAVLSAGIQGHGSLLVRGLVAEPVMSRMRTEIDAVFQDRLDHPDGGAIFVPLWNEADPTLQGSRQFMNASTLLMCDAPKALAIWVQELTASPAFVAVSDYLAERPVLSAKKTTLYRALPDTGSAWHQDGAFLGPATRTVNLWVALSDCGVDAPGLDVVPRRFDHIVEPGTGDAYFDWSVGENSVAKLMDGRPTAMPAFKAGDAMLFDNFCLHRTGVRPGMTKIRYGIETWMFAPSHYPDGSPLVI